MIAVNKEDRMTTVQHTIGIDLGDRKSHACVLDAAGDVLWRGTFASTRDGITTFLGGFTEATVVMEVGQHSRWASAAAQELGHEVIVANPVHVRMIYASTTKSDRFDAEALARLARVDRRLLHPIHHRGRAAQTALAIVKSRDMLVRARTNLLNHVRMVVKADGGRLASCDADQFAKKVKAALPDALSVALKPIVDTIEQLTARIRELESVIVRVAKTSFPETERLLQVKGVGPVTALAFVLTIEDPARFKDAREVGAYLGMVPKRRQSGDTDPQLRISKVGDKYLRRLLVNCAHYITGPLGPECDLRRFGHKLAPPGSKTRKKRAVVAVARKLSVLLVRLWQNGTVYEPHRQLAAA
jgi:transposase